MTEAHVRPATSQRFCERIRDRYRARRGLLRSRALLVHRRPVCLAAAAIARARPVAPIARQQFALQIHLHTLAWPPGIDRHVASPDAKRREALQTLLTLGKPSAPSQPLSSQVTQRLVAPPVMAQPADGIAGRPSAASRTPAPPRPAQAASTRLVSVVSNADLAANAATGSRPLVHAARQRSPQIAAGDQGNPADRAGVRRRTVGGDVGSRFAHLDLTEFAPASRLAGQARTGRSPVQDPSASPLYARPVARSFAFPPDVPSSQGAPPEPRSAQPTPAEMRIPAPPPIDLERLTDDVYHHLQRRMRIERERRGL